MGVILFAGLIRVSFVLSEGNSNAPKKLRLENQKGARSLFNVNNLWEGNAMKRVNQIGMGLIILFSTVFFTNGYKLQVWITTFVSTVIT